MKRYIAKRLGYACVSLALLSLTIFLFVRLTGDPAVDCCASWSPDGIRVAFYSDRDGDDEIWLAAADGAEPRPLTDGPGAARSPASSGSKLTTTRSA